MSIRHRPSEDHYYNRQPQATTRLRAHDHDEMRYDRREFPEMDRYAQPQGRRESRGIERKFGNLPKTLVFDGKTSWQAFHMKFSKYAEVQGWTAKECKDSLCWCLTDKASEFYANTAEKDSNIEYFDLIKKFERRFSYKDLPETATIAFNSTRQSIDESLEDWADIIMTLATKAFRDLPDDYMYRQAILRFCHGCTDRDAGENAANARPTSMEDAVDKIKWAIHTHNAIYGKPRREVRQVYDDHETYSVCALKEQSQKRTNTTEYRIDTLEKKMTNMQTKQELILTKMQQLMDTVEKRQRFSERSTSGDARRSPATSPSRGTSTLRCFRCNGNHFVRDCPVPRPDPTETKKVQFVETDSSDGSLNTEGSDEEA